MAKTNIRGTQISDGSSGVDLTVDVFGALPTANGGTGQTAAGAAGNLLTSDGTNWTSALPPSNRPSYSYATPPLVTKNSYSNEFGIYNFKSSNTRRLNQGLANCMMGKSGGGMTEHLWIGDSLSAGTVSAVGVYTFDRLNTVALAFRDGLANAGVPANGTGFVRIADSTVTPDSRWSFTGSWSNSNQTMLACNTVNSTATFTTDRFGTVCDVWYYDGTGATFTVTINGSLVATVVCTGSAGWKYQHITGQNIQPGSTVLLTETVHGTFGTFLSGLSIWTPNAGLVMHNVAQNGSLASGTGNANWQDLSTNTTPGTVFQYVGGVSRTVTDATSTVGSPNLGSATAAFTNNDVGRPIDYTPGSAGPAFPPQCYIGSVTSSTVAVVHQMIGGVSTPVNALQTTSSQTVRIGREPSCIHIALGVNDMLGGASTSTITTAITTIRNRYPNSDCILHLEPEMANSFVANSVQAAYWQAMYTLADTLDVPLYDWRDRVGTYAQGQANGVYGDVNVHLTGATQASIGASLAQIVGFGSAEPQSMVTPVWPQDLTNKKYVDALQAAMKTDYTTTTPASPATGVQLFSRFRSRHLPTFVDPTGVDQQLQPGFFSNRMIRYFALDNSATPVSDGITATTAGTATAVAKSAPNVSTGLGGSVSRVRFSASTGLAGQGWGWRGTNALFFITAVANAGGFFLVWRFGQTVATNRAFIGLQQSTAAVNAATDPLGSITQSIGFGKNQADTNFKIFSVGATAGTNTNVDTGISASITTSLYEARLYNPSGNSTQVFWSLQELSTNAFAQGVVTTNLPALNTAMCPHWELSNGTAAVTGSTDFQAFYAETDN